MNQAQFPNLFSPLTIAGKTIRNRIMSTGHDTTLPDDGYINDAYIAYQEARALGGAGLIVLQVSAVHDSARYSSHVLMATDDGCIEGYRKMADTCHQHDAVVYAQLFHPGREIMETADGLAPVAYSASAIHQERFHVMPRTMSVDMISEIVAGYASAAKRMEAAGIDGVEIVASHGYLPSQFLNPCVNKRTDQYGGCDENRLRFLQEVIAEVRNATSDHFAVGLRISSREMDEHGLQLENTLAACKVLSVDLDFINIIAGTSATLVGAVHIVPPMTTDNAYLASDSKLYKEQLDIPVFVAGRINQPQEAEQVLLKKEADIVGMTRALICDPNMPEKAAAGRFDDIRACIGCNQACIGHFHRGLPISCIQHPETGRELIYGFGGAPKATTLKKVMIIGGGPAGLKAASIAAGAGHKVTLYEASKQLGGQVNIAQKVIGRAEFGGLATNLTRECEIAGVDVVRNTKVDRSLVEREQPDVVIIATGATPYIPEFENYGEMQVVNNWQILNEEVVPGASVVIADWKCDWVGMGLAQQLAGNGHKVRLAVNGVCAGELLQSYVRTSMIATLHRLEVEVIPYMRLFGCDDDTVYMQHTASGDAVMLEEVDTLVLSYGQQPTSTLAEEISDLAEVHTIGDALAARTAEEAVYDGLKVAWNL
ncbi:FAD-dependent oxidoreductase [Amphritea sp. 1_MG-2023]|uniref:oxidoreductase n=1 Tax=Amphritea sp. 1_MG-2023 TaxID=3062670 RepID=UPI0026E2242D|nr:FAD-dependent oxidoreductase [Amphritea sp. 1_MG-2023]MDO6563302.1 FAD-dependent oxidoreductase [Amphritea sp. 1_MG-2023]